MSKTFCVYETYKIDEPHKNYIGKSSLQMIKKINYLGSGKHLKRAIKKYGKGMFDIRILKEFDTEDAAYEYEGKLEPHENGHYNISAGGKGGQSGTKRPDLAAANRCRVWDDAAREKISETSKGRIPNDETRKKMSVNLKGNTRRQGTTHTEATKKKLSAASKKMWQEKATAEGRTRYRKRPDGKGGSWEKPHNG
tara:strand:+ start:122 stop:706 length:585 start_codon:yes stop_codon:yes gene_type:complete